MTTPLICKTCRKPKASFECGLCHEHMCKGCTQFLTENSFAFLKNVPTDLTFFHYCTNCFDEKVSAPLNDYNETMEKAKEIILYSKEQTKLTRLLKRKEEPYFVENCEDEQEAIMRMSFLAVQGKFNALIDLELKNKKIIVGSHKKTIFSGVAVPITIDPTKIRGHVDPP